MFPDLQVSGNVQDVSQNKQTPHLHVN